MTAASLVLSVGPEAPSPVFASPAGESDESEDSHEHLDASSPRSRSTDADALAPAPVPKTAEGDDKRAAITTAEDAWGRGDFLEVRSLLEPIADTDPLSDRVQRETLLVLLADATLLDVTLPSDERQARATEHLGRIMDANGQWQLPPKIYSPELYNLYLDVREQRIGDAGSQCEADRLACEADADAVEAELRDTQRKLAQLQLKYDNQEVAIGEKRTRALALFPLGISQFLNGDRALGATFLVAETAFGIAGLSLLFVRVTGDGCRRTRAFQSGSLVCSPRDGRTREQVLNRRQAEEAMGWFFLGSVALDILIAQLRFTEFEITGSRPRSELEGGRRSPRREKRRRATVKPRSGASRHGASLGFQITF